MAEIILESQIGGRFRATTDPVEAVLNSEVSLVCVGTPSNGNGSLDLKAVKAVARQIGEALREKSYHCIVFRSTVLPGTVRNVLIPILSEASEKTVDRDFDVCFNPESAVRAVRYTIFIILRSPRSAVRLRVEEIPPRVSTTVS